MHLLKPSHSSEKPSRIVFFDTESHVQIKITDDEIQNVLDKMVVTKKHVHYLTCACYWDRGIETWVDYTDRTLNDFWDEVDAFTPNKTKTYLFAHNAKYDTLISGGVPYLVKLGYTVDGFSDDNPFILKMHKRDSKGKIIKSIIILSSTNYFSGASIEKLGETFGLNKEEIEYAGDGIDKEIHYCRRDVEIMKLSVLYFLDMVKRENLGNFSMTIASQAFSAYRHRFMPHEIFIHREKPVLILERDAYAGGRNEAWYIGEYTGNVFYFDVNSMYPYVMKNEKFPVKLLSYRKRIDIDDLQDILDKGYLVTAKVFVHTALPKYFKKGEKLLFPVGKFWTTLSTPELKEALANNEILKIQSAAIYEGDYIFADYVDYFYTERMKAKMNHDDVLSFFFKIFLNSLYGKFGQKAINWEVVGAADVTDIGAETVYNADTNSIENYKTFGGNTFKKEKDIDGESESLNSFPAIAAHVTAYARMLIWQNINIAGMENVLYMDTDSIFGNEEAGRRLDAAGIINNKELGKMKIEEYGTGIIIHGCKDYKFHTYERDKSTGEYTKDENGVLIPYDMEKIKGVSKKAVRINENQFVCSTWGGFSKYIKEGDLHQYENRLMLKTLKRKYDKGTILKNGRVTPFVLNESEVA